LPVSDPVTSITNLIYTASLYNTNLIQAVNFSFNGSNEIATIVPVPYKSGVSPLTISVSDGINPPVSETNHVSVTFVEYPPTLAPIPNTNTTANTPVNVVLVVTDVAGLPLSYNASIGNPSVISAVNFSVVGSNEVATVIPAPNATGPSAITLTVSDGITNASQIFTVTVTNPPPPVLGFIPAQFTPENTPTNVVLPVSDSFTSISNLTYSAIIPSPSVVASVTFSYVGTNEIAKITPVANESGVSKVTIVVSDGINPAVSNTFSVTVELVIVAAPTLTATVANGELTIAFTGTPGVTYTIESSSNLETWTTAGTATANASTGAAQYTAAVSSTGAVYYRAVAP